MIKILNYQELINKMKDKGIKFEIIKEDDAIKFLMKHNYYVQTFFL